MNRYHKQILLPEIGDLGQEKLAKAKVLVVGAGGLGCPVLQYLGACGVGTLGLVDHDLVAESNLARQALYMAHQVGKPKVACAKEFLLAQNPLLTIHTYQEKFTAQNALLLVENYDVVVDCTDNFPVRYAVNDACVLLNKPFVYGAIHRFEGQVSLFNYTDTLGNTGPSYRCVFPEKPQGALIPNCNELGVLGVVPGLVGGYQAMEVMKVLLDMPGKLSGTLLQLDLLTGIQQKIKIRRTAEALTMARLGLNKNHMQELSVHELDTWFKENNSFKIIDVREPFEYELCHLPNATLMPLGSVSVERIQLENTKPLVFLCHHGIRSKHAIQYLEQAGLQGQFFNLEGGIDAWSRLVDPMVARY
jgi:sulfur-carrier protein adenylyltransferase/sulfurtransferase